MDIYIYSDESGVLDKAHNKYFVFGGIVFLSKNDKDNFMRKYANAEKVVRQNENKRNSDEVKATTISNKDKGKLYRALNQVEKFGIIINQEKLFDSMFEANSKKNKQRYLDWAYKMAVKRKFEILIAKGLINPNDVENLYFYVDEHTTATNGIYELRESLEQEFKLGIYNWDNMMYIKPIFPNLKSVQLDYCNSKTKTLVRAADIVANRLYYLVRAGKLNKLDTSKFNVVFHP